MSKRRKIDYAFKSKILREHSDLVLRQKQASLLTYSLNRFNNEGIISYPLLSDKYTESMSDFQGFCIENDLMPEYLEIVKINHAEQERIKRLKERVRALLIRGKCIFITFTFNDSTLANTTSEQRRKAVSRYLRKYSNGYIANIDFGKTNHREHYHALIQCERVNSVGWSKYGSIDFERVRLKSNMNNDIAKLSKYVSKLSNHAIKETAKRSSLMYSRF